ncbi:fungal-specific transcription factor domain-containing protein [Lineolata rhizophorae]|uniref:Fungal-specific transcription factor domain-containing protein n=1 Tax=Lineolata rhizophorae TaxID=578093 RepID=A0A6A6PAP4_9PEZI|nr:fungal-specific transcription factor domain-containing protein [Lineolata rhizophorae]
MRSSIACARCRRSKVKCVNNGVNTTCRACETTGRECTYPPPMPGPGGGGSGGAVGRRESLAHAGGGSRSWFYGERARSHRRPRMKKPPAPSGYGLYPKESPRALVDALDPNLLTPKVWTELFEIFQLHFSTDLPFVHPPTFLKPLRQGTLHSHQNDYGTPSQDRPSPAPMPPGSPPLLLSFLALTARFHPQLVAYHSPSSVGRPSNPLAASEYYCAAARSRLSGTAGDAMGSPTLERCQAFLMLGLHEWGMCRGVKAWIAVGIAIRSAQVLGLQFERDLDDEPMARSFALSSEAEHMGIAPSKSASQAFGKSEAFIEQEIKRRTFWSCFLMDRYLSSGKYRPQMLSVKDLRVQLPSSDRAFHFGEKVRTLLLNEESEEVAGRAEIQSVRQATRLLGSSAGASSRSSNADANGGFTNPFADSQSKEDEENGRWEVGPDEGVLSRYVKLVDLYGRIVRWSCSGGRRTEKHPPWDERSQFYSLRKNLSMFKDSLPRDLVLTGANIQAHISLRSSTPFTLMHTTLCLCSIMLHREYVPFIPLRCRNGPSGPLDPPLFPPEEYQIPEGFWEQSAKECFKPARDLVDLLRTCQDWNVLVETPLVGFATYTAAFVGVYCINFPWMDPDGYMCRDTNGGSEAARKALEIVGQMRRRLQMADGWFKTIERCHKYYMRMIKDFERNSRALETSSMSSGGETAEGQARHLSLREGGLGGGLAEYKLLEKTLKEFGTLEDEDVEMENAPGAETGVPRARQRTGDEVSEVGSAGVKSEAMDVHDGTPDSAGLRQERWNAINSVAAAANQQRAEAGGSSSAMGNGTTAAGYPVATPQSQFHSPWQQQLTSAAAAGPSPGPSLVSPGAQSISTVSVATPYDRSSSHALPPPAQQQQHQQGAGQYGAAAPASLPHGQGHGPSGGAYATDQAAQRASLTLQQQLQPSSAAAAAAAAAAGWTPDNKGAWLDSLTTSSFGGDDLALFVDGSSYEDYRYKQPPGGWLSQVWQAGPGGATQAQAAAAAAAAASAASAGGGGGGEGGAGV